MERGGREGGGKEVEEEEGRRGSEKGSEETLRTDDTMNQSNEQPRQLSTSPLLGDGDQFCTLQ